ncbi:MAG: hypothetical protein AB6733_18200 [Clostridiaceae bacterium]
MVMPASQILPAPNSNLPASGQPPPKTPKKRGAPLGNNNAVKHGFYARRLLAVDLDGFDQMEPTALTSEIEVMRIFIRRVVELSGNNIDLATAIEQLRIITFATIGINRLIRTQITLAAPAIDPSQILQQALIELEEEWPELHECKERIRNGTYNDPP